MDVLLRVEGVNLSGFIDDTADLSTIRGSSLVLPQTVKDVAAWLRQTDADKAEPLSLGASTGLFRIEVADGNAAERLRREIEHGLTAGKLGVDAARFATFVVDVEPMRSDDDFVRAREAVLARNRWRQMQAPRLFVPVEEPTADGVCVVDQVRPGKLQPQTVKKYPSKCVSEAVRLRRSYGIDNKKSSEFYARALEEFGLTWPAGLPAHLARYMAEIAAPPGSGRLAGKVALVYADANSLGKIQRACIRGKKFAGRSVVESEAENGSPARRQEAFDTRMRGYRAQLLSALLARLAGLPGLANGERKLELPDGKESTEPLPYVRLETQLWGGDELVWVVPATLGHEVVRLLFAKTEDWSFGAVHLTHAVGVVFCHDDAPIARIRRLAGELADRCKRAGRDRPAGRSLVAYEVLESFDHIGRDLDAYRRGRCPPGVPSEAWLLEPADWQELAAMARDLTEELPRRQLDRLAGTLQREGVGGSFVAAEKRLLAEHPEIAERTADLRRKLGAMAWVHLEELWDYIAEPIEEPDT